MEGGPPLLCKGQEDPRAWHRPVLAIHCPQGTWRQPAVEPLLELAGPAVPSRPQARDLGARP